MILVTNTVWAQTVSIISDSIICKNAVISFSHSSTQTPTAFNWTYGDGSSSTQVSPSTTYNSVGPKTITLEVTFANGQKATDTKVIMVHDLPKADFELENPNFCFNQKNICLKDKSNTGSTTQGYENRIILWGDGASNNSNNPKNGDVICYSQYPRIGDYKITIEVRNDKGCTDKWERNITILEDYVASFEAYIDSVFCDSVRVEFENDSISRNYIASYSWDFGNGKVNNTNWSQVFSTYEKDTTITAKLTVRLTNGCVSVAARDVLIKLPKPNLNISVDTQTLCYPYGFNFSAPVSFDIYNWAIFDENSKLLLQTLPLRFYTFSPGKPGKYKVVAFVSNGVCKQTTDTIFIESKGVKANFIPLNYYSCNTVDTVFFRNESLYDSATAQLSFKWFFDDPFAPDCISSNGLCNRDTVKNSFHIYSDFKCYEPKLVVHDAYSGCTDSLVEFLQILKPPTIEDFTLSAPHPCLGTKLNYGITLSLKSEYCGGEFFVNWDSLAGRENFNIFEAPSQSKNYTSTKDSNGNVVIGVSYDVGEIRKYHSWDLNDFTDIPERKCIDTLWFPGEIKLHVPKNYEAQLRLSECRPMDANIILLGDTQLIDSVRLFWGDDSPEIRISNVHENNSWKSHTYDSNGVFRLILLMYDSANCYNYFEREVNVGWYRDFDVPKVVCRGAELAFDATIYYWDNNSRRPWEDSLNDQYGYERVRWDFDDGNGFVGDGTNVTHTYTDTGTYLVRMATKNQGSCFDTLTKLIEVGTVTAVIQYFDSVLVCDQIVQLFDSSYTEFGLKGDRIINYEWNFGSNTTPSFLKNPFHYFNKFGKQEITLKIETNNGCIDSTSKMIEIKGPRPNFETLSDSLGCNPFEVTIGSNSQDVTQWIWRLGDNSNTTFSINKDDTFTHTYRTPGTYHIFLEGIDSLYNPSTQAYSFCKGIFPDTANGDPLRTIVVLEVPKVDFSLPEIVCKNEIFMVNSLSNPRYNNFFWYVNDSLLSENRSQFELSFADTGNYYFKLSPTYIPDLTKERYCFDSTEKMIQIRGVDARFSFEPISDCGLYQFEDTSLGGIERKWDFGHAKSDNRNFSDEINPKHSFRPDTGIFNVCLMIESADNCIDTLCQDIWSTFTETAKFYNVFTPNEDGINDEFFFDLVGVMNYQLSIFNRWGERVFYTDNPDFGWDGKNVSGQKCPAGSYFYVVTYTTLCTRVDEQVEGVVTLIRE